MCSFCSCSKSRSWIQHEPYKKNHSNTHNLLAKFYETCSAETIDVHLVYGSSKLKPECRVYKMPNNSRYLLDDSRTLHKRDDVEHRHPEKENLQYYFRGNKTIRNRKM